MARYTGFFIVSIPVERLRQVLIEILEACNLNIIYDTGDYIMAREIPGQVSIAKLVTLEVLIDKNTVHHAGIRMDFVVKNEELPFQANNHCRLMFELVGQLIRESRQWRLVESMAI
ncbi:MAG: hypothetical protein ACM37W_14940 [Actinomycetota bacterium]